MLVSRLAQICYSLLMKKGMGVRGGQNYNDEHEGMTADYKE